MIDLWCLEKYNRIYDPWRQAADAMGLGMLQLVDVATGTPNSIRAIVGHYGIVFLRAPRRLLPL